MAQVIQHVVNGKTIDIATVVPHSWEQTDWAIFSPGMPMSKPYTVRGLKANLLEKYLKQVPASERPYVTGFQARSVVSLEKTVRRNFDRAVRLGYIKKL